VPLSLPLDAMMRATEAEGPSMKTRRGLPGLEAEATHTLIYEWTECSYQASGLSIAYLKER